MLTPDFGHNLEIVTLIIRHGSFYMPRDPLNELYLVVSKVYTEMPAVVQTEIIPKRHVQLKPATVRLSKISLD